MAKDQQKKSGAIGANEKNKIIKVAKILGEEQINAAQKEEDETGEEKKEEIVEEKKEAEKEAPEEEGAEAKKMSAD